MTTDLTGIVPPPQWLLDEVDATTIEAIAAALPFGEVAPPFSVDRVSPNRVRLTDGDVTFTIYGTGFNADTQVNIGGWGWNAQPFTLVSPTQIQFVSTIGGSPGVSNVKVRQGDTGAETRLDYLIVPALNPVTMTRDAGTGEGNIDFAGRLVETIYEHVVVTLAPGTSAEDFAADGAKEVIAFNNTTELGPLAEPDFSGNIPVSKMLGWVASETELRVREDQGGFPIEPAPLAP